MPTALHIVAPSRLATADRFSVHVRVLGEVRVLPPASAWNTPKPSLHTPFNRSVQRGIDYHDDCLPEWRGRLEVVPDPALEGPETLVFEGGNQGVFPGDTRPIASFQGFRWTRPGFHLLRLRDPESGVTATANPVYVTEEAPAMRLYWGDLHWQTYFSDGIRCPEELYSFARHEAFLDFGAITDHMSAITPRQWDYFQAVTNDNNVPGTFATLIGQEWTHHRCGHRNIYTRSASAPRVAAVTHTDLDALWSELEGWSSAMAVPHHPANVVMGCDWSQGWEPRFEHAVEIYSVWGNSERSAADGNPRPLLHCKGEQAGRHVLDALRAGYRFGFTGGGDIHDGRPGLCLSHDYGHAAGSVYPQGLTGAWLPALSREHLYNALRDQHTYATSEHRIYLEADWEDERVSLRAAAADGLSSVSIVTDRESSEHALDGWHTELTLPVPAHEHFAYLRVVTSSGDHAWSSPSYGPAAT